MPGYIKIGLRNLSKNSSYALINIIGLTVGIASFMLIMMYVQHELSYDNYLEKKHSLYRAVEIQHPRGGEDQHVAVTMGPLGPAMERDFPEVKNFVRLWSRREMPVELNGKIMKQDGIVYADTSVFNMFSIPLLYGNPKDALTQPKSVVISEKTALKYFSNVEDALGKIIKFQNEDGFLITGIMKDLPKEFHLQFDVIVSFITAESKYEWIKNWGSNSFATYVELIPNTDLEILEGKFDAFIEKYTEQSEDDSFYFELYLQPLNQIHLQSNHIKFQWQVNMGDIQIVYIFTIIAFLILLIACINFINIAISRSIRRAKEVGMRKVIGANRLNLIYQFNGESVIITFISIILSMGVVELTLPMFNQLLNTELAINFINNRLFNIGLFGVFILVSLITGLYPAYYLSKFKPLTVLKGTKGSIRGKSGLLTKILVAFQFTITIALIFSILVVNKQINYAESKDLGYDYTNVMTVPFFGENDNEKVDIIRAELMKNLCILNVSGSASALGTSGSQSFRATSDSIPQEMIYRICFVNPEFFDLMKIPIVEGRNFSRDYALDMRSGSVILNEAAVKKLGWDNPIGKRFRPDPDTNDSLLYPQVIGVVKDYNYYSLRTVIEPAYFIVSAENNRCVLVKFDQPKGKNLSKKDKENYLKQNVHYVEDTWKKLFPNAPFEYKFIEQQLLKLYGHEKNSLSIFTYFAILSILISCLGLYGLISFVVEQRTNEIGIRKVMGGSVIQIVGLLIKDFIKLIIIAGVVAAPLAIYLSEEFLQTFVYRISMPYAYLILSIFVALVIAIMTISFHAIKSANSNPIDALRYE